MKFVVVDQCPVPAKAAPFVLEAKRRSGQSLQSCYRGIDARAILNRFGKHDQTYLYNGFIRGLPGFNPANPPGFSTHECHNDGPAFPQYRRGARIPDELVGQDWSNGAAVAQTYRSMGVNAALTYPGSAREAQHVNIRTVPKKLTPPLRVGDGGPRADAALRKRVGHLTWQLHYCSRPRPHQHRRYLGGRREVFDQETLKAVKDFQRDHGLTTDGVVGEMTQHQLDLAYGHWWRIRHAPKKPTKPKPGRPTPPKPVIPHAVERQTLRCVDVSYFQGDINWNRVKASGIDFPLIKATEGMDWTDKTCTAGRVKAMVAAGFDIIGFYHYARPQPGRAPEVEARHFVNHVKSVHGLRPKGTILALDIEWVQGLGTAQLRSWVKGWLQEVERLTGIRPIIYTGAWFWNPRLGNPRTFFGRYALWLSAYVKNPAPFVPAAWKDGWTMWQYSDKGHVDGISSPCDVSTFHGSIHDLQRLAA